ncbi:MAG: TonB-dependent receptor [Vicinamibacteria bacterium]
MSLHQSTRTFRRFGLIPLTALIMIAASEASAAEVKGAVRTQNGLPVSQAAVRFASPLLSREVVTGSQGEFTVDLPEGSYIASVRGFEVDAAPLVVAGQNIALHIELLPAKIREDVLVSATRSRTAISSVGISASVIDDHDLKERQTLRLTDMLAELPGISAGVTGGVGGQGSLFVRGGEARFARVLIDGVPVNEPGGYFNFGTLLTPDLQRVEVIRGSFGTLYGSDALAGVVSLQTSAGDGPSRLRGEVGGGDLGTKSFSATANGKRGDASGSVSFGHSETDNDGPNADFKSNLFAASAERRATSGSFVGASFRLNTSEGGTPGQTLYGRPDLDASYGRDLLIATAFGQWNAGAVSHAARVGFKRDQQLSLNPLDSGTFLPRFGSRVASFTSSDFPGDPYANNTDRIFGTYELRGQIRQHSLTAGGDIEKETGDLGTVGFPALSPERTNYGAFLQDQIAFSSRAFATLSARIEHNGSTGTTFVPHGSIALIAARAAEVTLTLRASAGAGIKAPSFFESYGTSSFALGNPDLKPERARTYDGGVDIRVRDNIKVLATYFHHQYLDQIAYTVVSFSPFIGTYENLGETRANGVELSGEWRPTTHLRLLGNYTHQNSEIVLSTSTDEQLAVGKELRRRPKNQGSITAEATVSRATLAATLVSVGERADSDFLGFGLIENPGFTRVDLRAAVRVHRNARLLGTVENVGDKSYQEVLGYPALPRRFRISLSLDSLR